MFSRLFGELDSNCFLPIPFVNFQVKCRRLSRIRNAMILAVTAVANQSIGKDRVQDVVRQSKNHQDNHRDARHHVREGDCTQQDAQTYDTNAQSLIEFLLTPQIIAAADQTSYRRFPVHIRVGEWASPTTASAIDGTTRVGHFATSDLQTFGAIERNQHIGVRLFRCGEKLIQCSAL